MTKEDMTTREGCEWVIGKWKETSGEGELCGAGWLHAFEHPLLAALNMPAFGFLPYPAHYEGEAGGVIRRDGQFKLGATRMRILKPIKPPKITNEHRVAYSILASLAVYKESKYIKWALSWLDNTDRSSKSAHSLQRSLQEKIISYMAHTDEEKHEILSGYYAAAAADSFANPFCGICLTLNKNAATAAGWANMANPDIDLLTIAKKAMEYQTSQ